MTNLTWRKLSEFFHLLHSHSSDPLTDIHDVVVQHMKGHFGMVFSQQGVRVGVWHSPKLHGRLYTGGIAQLEKKETNWLEKVSDKRKQEVHN